MCSWISKKRSESFFQCFAMSYALHDESWDRGVTGCRIVDVNCFQACFPLRGKKVSSYGCSMIEANFILS